MKTRVYSIDKAKNVFSTMFQITYLKCVIGMFMFFFFIKKSW